MADITVFVWDKRFSWGWSLSWNWGQRHWEYGRIRPHGSCSWSNISAVNMHDMVCNLLWKYGLYSNIKQVGIKLSSSTAMGTDVRLPSSDSLPPLTGVKLGLFYLIKNNNHTLDTILSFDSLLYLLILIINLKDCKNVTDYSTYITNIKIWKKLQPEVNYWLFVWLNSFVVLA